MATSDQPFIGSEAVSSGQWRKHQLRSRFQAVFPDVYVRRDQYLTAQQRALAAWLWSQRRGVLAGRTAAAWHGSKWVDDHLPVELIWSNSRPPHGIRTYDMRLATDEFGLVASVPVTTPARTAFDIGRRGQVGAAVAQMDALARAVNLTIGEVAELADRHRGARNLRQLEKVLELTDPGAQSPRETWLRLLLVRAGLPCPTTQIPVVNPDNGQRFYLDMGWEDSMVAVEYDGEQHRLDQWQYKKDIRRQEQLARLGWTVIRVIAGDQAADIIRRVRTALDSRRPSLR